MRCGSAGSNEATAVAGETAEEGSQDRSNRCNAGALNIRRQSRPSHDFPRAVAVSASDASASMGNGS